MLQSIHEHAKGWIAILIIGLLSIIFALWGIEYYLHGNGSNRVVAKVNGEAISAEELQATYQQARQQLQSQLGSNIKITPELQTELRHKALQNIINREVISQAMTDIGFRISNSQLSSVIQQMPSFQVDGHFSPSRFQQALSSFGTSEQSFVRQMEQSLLIGQLQYGITSTAFSLPNEIQRAVVLTNQTRDLGFVQITVNDFLPKVKVTDDQIKKYYETNKKDYANSQQVSVDYLEFKSEDLKQRVNVSDQEVKDYYQSNSAAFNTPERWQIRRISSTVSKNTNNTEIAEANKKIVSIAAELAKGKKFEEFSPTEAEWIENSRFNGSIVNALKNLKPGQTTSPITVSDGFIIVKLVKHESPVVKPFDSVKAQLKDELQKQKLEHDFLELSNQMADMAYTTPDNLKPLADLVHASVKTSPLFDRSGSKTPPFNHAKVLEAAFSDDVLLDNNNSNLIEIEPGHVLVLRRKDLVEATPKPLAEVHDSIKKILIQQYAKVLASEMGEKLLTELKDQQNIADKVKKAGFVWRVQSGVTRQQPGLSGEMLRLAFHLPDPTVIHKTNIAGQVTKNGDYVIIQVMKVNQDPQMKITPAEQGVFSAALERSYGRQEYDLFVAGLTKQAKIKIYNDSLIE